MMIDIKIIVFNGWQIAHHKMIHAVTLPPCDALNWFPEIRTNLMLFAFPSSIVFVSLAVPNSFPQDKTAITPKTTAAKDDLATEGQLVIIEVCQKSRWDHMEVRDWVPLFYYLDKITHLLATWVSSRWSLVSQDYGVYGQTEESTASSNVHFFSSVSICDDLTTRWHFFVLPQIAGYFLKKDQTEAKHCSDIQYFQYG